MLSANGYLLGVDYTVLRSRRAVVTKPVMCVKRPFRPVTRNPSLVTSSSQPGVSKVGKLSSHEGNFNLLNFSSLDTHHLPCTSS